MLCDVGKEVMNQFQECQRVYRCSWKVAIFPVYFEIGLLEAAKEMRIALEQEGVLAMVVTPEVCEKDHNRTNKVFREVIRRETVIRKEMKPGLKFDIIE